MALSTVAMYERLKPHLGEEDSKALLDYVDDRISGEVATKEDVANVRTEVANVKTEVANLRTDTKEDVANLRNEMLQMKIELKEEIWKLRILILVVLAVNILLNPKLLELVGQLLGVAK
jgi:hypothetical protein